MNRFAVYMVVLLAPLTLLLASTGWTTETPPAILKGPPFSNPDDITPKPAAWQQQPVRYRPQDAGLDVTLLLDQNIYPGLLPLVQEFARAKQWNVAVHEGTCGPAAEGILRKEVDIGGSCCPTAKEDRLPGLRWHTVGISPMAMLVNAADPIDNLTSDQVRDIFQGKLTRWAQIPTIGDKISAATLIRPITRLHCKFRPGHWRLILDNEELFGPRVSEVGTIMDVAASVGRTRGALGYVENWQIVADPKYRETVKAIQINGQDPRNHNAVATGLYPFYWVYNVSTWSADNTVNPKAQQLVQYLIDHADRIDPALHLVPAAELKKKGWKFKDDELVGEP
ncbi:MAG: substrate-binding domain-containing protein [Magnetococcales bacterium]|nr:substrate-binding domain-containing protein [Magnetococcales bacterium]